MIGTEVNQDALEVAADQGEVAHGPGVDREGGFRLTFSTIHEVVRGAVDDDVQPQSCEELAHPARVGQINPGAGEGKDLPGKARVQVAPQLSVGAENGGFHEQAPPRCCAQSGGAFLIWSAAILAALILCLYCKRWCPCRRLTIHGLEKIPKRRGSPHSKLKSPQLRHWRVATTHSVDAAGRIG